MSENGAAPSRPQASPGSLERAILRTVAYADLFDYPLTTVEVHRYLTGVAAPLAAVQEALEKRLLPGHRLEYSRGYVMLPGRAVIVEARLSRGAVSVRMWRKGRRYGRAIASLPFVRLVAVTGTLAVNNLEAGQDIDYLIVTAPQRVWLARLFVLSLVYLGRLERLTICPNYVLSNAALSHLEPSFFTAHELAQMIPLFGRETYLELMRANAWARDYLPNAFDAPDDRFSRHVSPFLPAFKRVSERLLEGRLGDAWEAHERKVKIARLVREAAACGSSGAVFTADCCKGHLDDHGNRIQEAYAARLRQVGLDGQEAETILSNHRGST